MVFSYLYVLNRIILGFTLLFLLKKVWMSPHSLYAWTRTPRKNHLDPIHALPMKYHRNTFSSIQSYTPFLQQGWSIILIK